MQSLFLQHSSTKYLTNHHHPHKVNGIHNVTRFRRCYFSGTTEDITKESKFESLVRIYAKRRYIPKKHISEIKSRFKFLLDSGVSTNQLNIIVTENIDILDISLTRVNLSII